MNELINYNCIDFKKLLVIKSKALKLSDQECYILIVIMTMLEIGIRPITPANISQLCTMSIKKIDDILMKLIDKHLISRKNGKLDLSPLQKMLLNEENKEEEKSMDLVSLFENTFGRSLNQMELSIINGFKTNGYDDQMIMDALNESVKSGVINFRYIEKILDNWSKHGVKRRYAPMSTNKVMNQVDDKVKDYQWWQDNE